MGCTQGVPAVGYIVVCVIVLAGAEDVFAGRLMRLIPGDGMLRALLGRGMTRHTRQKRRQPENH